ncbi:MAG: phosphatidate cytidylyltransferase [Bacteroidetes bacterium]|nr:phosphatidate cytidylyltransferase [Bacteroidota bacterium]
MRSMSNIVLRTITGIFFVLAVLGSVAWSPYPFALLFLVFTLLGLYEFFRMMNVQKTGIYKWFGMFAGMILYLTVSASALDFTSPLILIVNILILIFIMILALFSGGKYSFEGAGMTFLGIVYIAMPFGLLNFFYEPQSEWFAAGLIMGFFLIQWLYDIFAYLGGRIFGKHRLSPEISPRKTWEGMITGAVITLGGALLVNQFVCPKGVFHWLVIALIIIAMGSLGDLAESMIKRYANVKDTGNIFPGHGGVLDRFDSVLFSAPAVFVYLKLFL